MVRDQVRITVVAATPNVSIDRPADGAEIAWSSPILLQSSGRDPSNPPTFALEDVRWLADGVEVATGPDAELPGRTLAIGEHTLRVEATGLGGDTVFDEVTVDITPDPADLPPEPRISAPHDGAVILVDAMDGLGWYANVTLRGTAPDAEDGPLTGAALVWSDSVNGAPAVELGTGTTLSVRLRSDAGGSATHAITLTATDSAGNVETHTVTIYVEQMI